MPDEDVLVADDAERAVLGGLLLDPSLLTGLGDLNSADFYRPAHATIFQAIREAVSSGDRVDQLVVMETLRTQGELVKIGGAPYLHTCTAAIPTVGNTGYYARFVQQAAMRRQLLEYATRLRQACLSPDLEDTLEQAAEIGTAIGAVADENPTVEDPIGEIRELSAFVAERRDRPRAWVIPGLLQPMERVVVVASEGAGKTTWARAVAAMLGQGVHPLNPNLQIPPKRVLIVDLENPPDLIADESARLIRASGQWVQDRVFLWSRPGGVDLRKATDAALLDRLVGHVRPALVCLGPLYKAAISSGRERDEQVALETASALDKLRTRHRVALWLEHHAPLAQAGHRDLRPIGSSVWSRWPEFGIALRRDGDRERHTFRVERFRGDRARRCWPDELTWGARWPFDCKWDQGMPGGLHDGGWDEGAA